MTTRRGDIRQLKWSAKERLMKKTEKKADVVDADFEVVDEDKKK